MEVDVEVGVAVPAAGHGRRRAGGGPARRPRRRTGPCRAAAAVVALAAGLSVVLLMTAPAGAGTAPLAAAASPPDEPSRDLGLILLVIDASGSMLDPDGNGEPKIEGAKRALVDIVRELPAETPVGLRAFGEGPALSATPETCRDTRLTVPVAPLDRDGMVDAIVALDAQGWTPMGHALTAAGADLPRVGRGSIILVSDGVDECFPSGLGPEPCEVAARLTQQAIDLRVHTIGLTVDAAAREQLQCIAAVTGGDYFDADDAESLADALRAGVQAPPAPEQPIEPPPDDPALRLAMLGAGGVAVLLVLVAGVRSLVARHRRAYW